MARKFEFHNDAAGRFQFWLTPEYGATIAVGEAYDSTASALSGIDSVRPNAPDAPIDDQTC